MATSRYNNSWILNNNTFGPYFETFGDYWFIYDNIQDGTIKSHEVVTNPSVRLDHISFQEFGDSQYWWIIALCNNIGFAPQVRGGTSLLIPNNLNDVLKYFD